MRQNLIEKNKSLTSDLKFQIHNLKQSIKMRETTSQIVQKEFDKAVNKTVDMFMQKETTFKLQNASLHGAAMYAYKNSGNQKVQKVKSKQKS